MLMRIVVYFVWPVALMYVNKNKFNNVLYLSCIWFTLGARFCMLIVRNDSVVWNNV
jgi:hypothetical protein